MKKFVLFIAFSGIISLVYSQTVVTDTAGYTTADGSAVMDVRSTTKGLLLPRLTASQKGSVSSPADGLLLYQSSGSTGLYLRNNGSWEKLGTYSLPSLTSGSVLFSDGTTISQDNSNFKWDNVNKRLGIGTSPNYNLHVVSSTGTNNWPVFVTASNGSIGNRAITGYSQVGTGSTSDNYGIFGQVDGTTSGINCGSYGIASGSSTENFGVYGNTVGDGTYNFGVNGKSTGTPSGAKYNYGVNGYAGGATGTNSYNVGVFGESVGTGTYNIGVSGRAQVTDNVNYGMWGGAYGVGTSTNYAVRAWAANGGTANYAVYATATGTSAYSFYGNAGAFYNASTGSFGGNVTVPTLNTGNGNYELYAMNQNVQTTDAVTFATINTGEGANELYDMNQNVQTTDAVTFATINTGEGANELYDMNQNVTTTSDVTFANISGTGISLPFASKTSAYTITSSDYSIAADASSGAFDITLPTASGITGRIYFIKRINSGGNAVTVVTTSSQTIDGATTFSLSAQYASLMVQSNGSNWIIISKF